MIPLTASLTFEVLLQDLLTNFHQIILSTRCPMIFLKEESQKADLLLLVWINLVCHLRKRIVAKSSPLVTSKRRRQQRKIKAPQDPKIPKPLNEKIYKNKVTQIPFKWRCLKNGKWKEGVVRYFLITFNKVGWYIS